MTPYIDGDKPYLGFEFEGLSPVVKTDPDFTTKKALACYEWAILRYVAMNIIDQLQTANDPDVQIDWKEINDNNFLVIDTLALNNGYGYICANGHIIDHLYLAPGGQIMAMISDDEIGISYDVLIN